MEIHRGPPQEIRGKGMLPRHFSLQELGSAMGAGRPSATLNIGLGERERDQPGKQKLGVCACVCVLRLEACEQAVLGSPLNAMLPDTPVGIGLAHSLFGYIMLVLKVWEIDFETPAEKKKRDLL